jgi:hypothetical protein
MQFFRDMSEPASTDITQYSGYTKLSGDQQKKVAETYTNVYNNNQGKLGFKVAQGIAYETAKKMCEGFENGMLATRDASPGTIADDTGIDNSISKPGPTYEAQKKDPVSGMPTMDLEKSAMMKGILKKARDPEPPKGKKWVQSSGMKKGWKVQEGDAEDFQAGNDALVGMTEDEAGLVSGANPEEDGAAKILRMNHDTMCSGCGAVHPVDVMCFNGRTHSEAGAGGGNGSADILKQNHAQKGMKVEDSDPEIAAAARYLTNRAKVSGLMESLEEGSGDIQKKNVGQKCPDCGAMHDPKDECNNQSEPDTDKETKKEVDDANEILKKNHKDKGLEEKHIGFKALQGKLERSGKSAESAGAIAASIGKKKYGAAAMHKAAASHTPLGEDVELSEEIEQMWAENFYPAKPLEESCGNCSHPKSYHSKGCQTCNECERFTIEAVEESEHKKTQICYCGHEYGHHGNGGCKTCKHEGVVTQTKAAHQFRKNDYKERFEDEYNQIFAAQQGKINTSLANASLNWLPEELELQEGKGYDDIGPGDHVKFNHPLRGSDKVPQQGKGKVVMKGPAGWVVNMGGKHGTPGIVSKDNYVSHRKAVKKMTENQMIDSMTEDESPKPAVDPKKQAARKRANENRKERESVMRDMGLKKAKGALGGTYWESEELPEAETVKEETDPLMSAALGYINHEVSRAGGPSDLEEWKKGRSQFADPGGNSALRASSKSNPRNLPCPTCKEPNKLTPADKAKGYQCDGCANMEERGW